MEISTAKKLFGDKAVKNVMAAMTEEGDQKMTPVAFIDDEENNKPKRLKLAEVDVYGKQVMTLFDSGAIPEVMSAALCDHLNLSPRKTSLCITMVDNKEALLGEVVGLVVPVGPMKTEIACLVVRSSPHDLIVGRPSMKQMRVSLDFDKDVAKFRHSEGATCKPLARKRTVSGSSLGD